MPRDSDDEDELRAKLDPFYPPVVFLEYDVPERVPGLGAEHKLDQLELLDDKHYEFLDRVHADPKLFERFKQRLSKKSPADPTAAAVGSAAAATTSDMDRTIEEALLGRAEFAERQMVRLMICEPYMYASQKDKKRLLREAFSELQESLLLLETWGPETLLLSSNPRRTW